STRLNPSGDAVIWQCSLLMKPSAMMISHAGVVPILVAFERSLKVLNAWAPSSGTSQPTIGEPLPVMSICWVPGVGGGPDGCSSPGGPPAGCATTGSTSCGGCGCGPELNTLTPITTSTSAPSAIRLTISHGNPAPGRCHGGASVSATGSASSLSILRI